MRYRKTYTVYPEVQWNYPLILKKEEAGLIDAFNLTCQDTSGTCLDYIDKHDYLFINAPDLEAGMPYKIVINYERSI